MSRLLINGELWHRWAGEAWVRLWPDGLRDSAEDSRQRVKLHALDVARFGGIHFHFVALVHERGHLNDKSGFERRSFQHGAGRRPLKRGLGLYDLQLHGVRQL